MRENINKEKKIQCSIDMMLKITLYISHGSPTLSIDEYIDARKFLQSWKKDVFPQNPFQYLSSLLTVTLQFHPSTLLTPSTTPSMISITSPNKCTRFPYLLLSSFVVFLPFIYFCLRKILLDTIR